MQLDNAAPVSTDGLLPLKRVRRSTWKVLENAPEGPSTSGTVSDNGESSPVEDDNHLASPISPISPIRVETVTPGYLTVTPANQFGIVQEYQQPTAVPISEDWWRPLLMDFPLPPTAKRDVAAIIYPYPNISSFLFNLVWRRMQGIVSPTGRSSIAKVISDKRFKTTDLDVNYATIEKQIATDVQSPWGGNGWRSDTIIIEVPTGKKPTAASRRVVANARARNRQHDEVDPDADPYTVYKIPIHDVRTRSLTQTMLETIQDSSNSAALHWYGRKEVWQPPYHDAPPEQVWGELYTSDAFLNLERDLINAHPESEHPCVLAAFMIWSDSTHLAQFGQAKAWPIYAYFGNQSKYARCKPSTHSSRVVGYVPPVSDHLIFIALFYCLICLSSYLTLSPNRFELMTSRPHQHSLLIVVVNFSTGSGVFY